MCFKMRFVSQGHSTTRRSDSCPIDHQYLTIKVSIEQHAERCETRRTQQRLELVSASESDVLKFSHFSSNLDNSASTRKRKSECEIMPVGHRTLSIVEKQIRLQG